MSFEPLLSTSWTLCHERVMFWVSGVCLFGLFGWGWCMSIYISPKTFRITTRSCQSHGFLRKLFAFGILFCDYSIEEKDGQMGGDDPPTRPGSANKTDGEEIGQADRFIG